MDQTSAINTVRAYKGLVREHFPVHSMYLFGSYARGTQREDSDIDVAVILEEGYDDFFAVAPVLWRLRRQVDVRIEPVLLDKNNDPSGFLREIQQTGIEIA